MERSRFNTSSIAVFLYMLWVPVVLSAADKPANPFDYSFCGGERVYPIVGINIATACGPRNQVALGRRGKLSWFYPAHDDVPASRGSYRLSEEQLERLSLLAEVTQISSPPAVEPARVMYKLGINFSARRPAYVHAPLTEQYTPANSLLNAMLALVPEQPRLPECGGLQVVFDPTLHRLDRLEALDSAGAAAGE